MLLVGTVHVPCSCPCAPYDMYNWAISRRQSEANTAAEQELVGLVWDNDG